MNAFNLIDNTFKSSEQIGREDNVNQYVNRRGIEQVGYGINQAGLTQQTRLNPELPDDYDRMFGVNSSAHANFLTASVISRDMDLVELTPEFLQQIKKKKRNQKF